MFICHQILYGPFVNASTFVAQCDSYGLSFTEVKVFAVVMIVRCYPAHPHRCWVLSGEYSHRVEVLQHKQGQKHCSEFLRSLKYFGTLFLSSYTFVMLPQSIFPPSSFGLCSITSLISIFRGPGWNSTGMLRRQQIMSSLLVWVPNVLWVTFRHGGESTVPSILVT